MRNMLDKIILIIVLMIIAIAFTPHITYANPNLSNDNVNNPSDWAKGEIVKAKENNLIPESIEGKYRSNITREEFCELAVTLYEILSGKKGTSQEDKPFTDTDNIKVNIANNLGIVNGIGDGKFAPNNMITREEIAVMIYRTLKVAKPQYNYSDLYMCNFTDSDMISSWAKESVGYLYKTGILNGVGNNRFNPRNNTSREEAIVLIKRMYDKVIESEIASTDSLIVSRGSTSRDEKIMKLKALIPQEMGKPYEWGATGPDSYDCSGLVYFLFGKLGISLPRSSRYQAKIGTYVSKENLEYGDLVFFARDGVNVNHVGLYIGNGKFVHAPNSGDVVSITTLLAGYYADTYFTARRVLH